jgi:hypothetical protein
MKRPNRNPIKRKASNDAWLARNLDQHRASNAKSYAGNREKRRAKQLETKYKNLKRYLCKGAKSRCKKNGLLFDITERDFEIPFTCPLLGYVLIPSRGLIAPNSPSLDRKDPRKGYVRGNVWVISYRANAAKSNLTLEELQMLVTNLALYG